MHDNISIQIGQNGRAIQENFSKIYNNRDQTENDNFYQFSNPIFITRGFFDQNSQNQSLNNESKILNRFLSKDISHDHFDTILIPDSFQQDDYECFYSLLPYLDSVTFHDIFEECIRKKAECIDDVRGFNIFSETSTPLSFALPIVSSFLDDEFSSKFKLTQGINNSDIVDLDSYRPRLTANAIITLETLSFRNSLLIPYFETSANLDSDDCTYMGRMSHAVDTVLQSSVYFKRSIHQLIDGFTCCGWGSEGALAGILSFPLYNDHENVFAYFKDLDSFLSVPGLLYSLPELREAHKIPSNINYQIISVNNQTQCDLSILKKVFGSNKQIQPLLYQPKVDQDLVYSTLLKSLFHPAYSEISSYRGRCYKADSLWSNPSITSMFTGKCFGTYFDSLSRNLQKYSPSIPPFFTSKYFDFSKDGINEYLNQFTNKKDILLEC